MTRALPEWRGKTDDTPPPPRVKDRIIGRQRYLCADCGLPFTPTRHPEFDHIVALINGGENRETNIQGLCRPCHGAKTATDVAVKAKVARVRKAHLGLKPRSHNPLAGSKGSPWKRTLDGRTVRRDAE